MAGSTGKHGKAKAEGQAPVLRAHAVIGSADDFMSFVEQLQGRDRVRAVFNAGAESGNAALIWASLLQAQKDGMQDFPAPLLSWLASVATSILAARTDCELWQAVGMRRPRKGGPGGAATAAAHFETKAIGDALWLEHARLTGDPLDEPPARLAAGVLSVVAQRFPGKSTGALKQMWRRYKAAGRRPAGDMLVTLPDTFFRSSRNR